MGRLCDRTVMRRRSLTVLLVALLAFAGCTAGPGFATDTAEPIDTAAGGPPPGVADGRLANASALVDAHETALADSGFAATVTRSVNGTQVASYDIVASPGLATYSLHGTQSSGNARSIEVHLWTNESIRLVKYTAGGESRYQATTPEPDSLFLLESVDSHLQAGNFTVTADSTAAGETVLTADDLAPTARADGRFSDATSFDGRVVVDASGRVRELTVKVERARGSETFAFDLRRTAVAAVDRPAWVGDIPPGATVTPQLSVDVRDETVLTVRNEAGDAVPANATLVVTTNDTTYRTTFDAPLEVGDVRYAAIAASDGTLRLTAKPPAAGDVTTLVSPVSVTIETEGGVTLLSVGMGWGSESASGSGGETAADGSSSQGSAGGSETRTG